jgi:hypothetical protein
VAREIPSEARAEAASTELLRAGWPKARHGQRRHQRSFCAWGDPRRGAGRGGISGASTRGVAQGEAGAEAASAELLRAGRPKARRGAARAGAGRGVASEPGGARGGASRSGARRETGREQERPARRQGGAVRVSSKVRFHFFCEVVS